VSKTPDRRDDRGRLLLASLGQGDSEHPYDAAWSVPRPDEAQRNHDQLNQLREGWTSWQHARSNLGEAGRDWQLKAAGHLVAATPPRPADHRLQPRWRRPPTSGARSTALEVNSEATGEVEAATPRWRR